MDKQALLEFLRSEVNRAREEYERTRDRRVIARAIPHPDEVKRIEKAAAAEKAAINAYTMALRRLSEFLISGKVPEDLPSDGK